MWWRLLEVGERIESGDEYWAGSWTAYHACFGLNVSPRDNPARRRVPSSGADFSAGKDRPEKLVKLGDRITVKSGTWCGCTGLVFDLDWPVSVELDNVYAGGNRLVITEPLDNVTVLVEPVAVDPEWRLLAEGEVIRQYDWVFVCGLGPWRECGGGTIGEAIHSRNAKHRRRVRVQSPGWRYLDAGEVVQAGDETIRENGICVPIKATGIDASWIVQDYGRFRRKTAPFAG